MAKKMKAFIAIGHGGSDPGGVANGIKEKDAGLVIGMSCVAELERHGVEVLASRYKDENDPVEERIKECNAFNPDVAVDLHLNMGKGNGAEVFHHYGGGTSKVLAKNIANELKAAGQNLRTGDSGKKDGLKTKRNSQGKDYFGFIRQTVCPACIVEHAFLDNEEDVKIVDTVTEQKAMGVADAKGILKTLGIKWKAPEKPVYTVTVTKLTDTQASALVKKLKKDGYTAAKKKA